MRFLVDENLPLSLIQLLQKKGHDVLDVAASPLRGSRDEKLWAVAAREKRILVSRDLDFPFSQIRPYPLGFILIRVPDNFKAHQITSLFSRAVKKIRISALKANITVVEPGRVRVRKLQ